MPERLRPLLRRSATALFLACAATVARGAEVVWDGRVISGTLVMQANSDVRVINGLTLDQGILHYPGGSGEALLRFSGTQTLGGIGELKLSRVTLSAIDGGTLTIGPGVRVMGQYEFSKINGPILNYGVISGGQQTTVQNLVNHGTLQAVNGGLLTVGTLTGDAGQLSVDTFGKLELDGNYVLSQPVHVQSNGKLTLRGSASLQGAVTVSGGGAVSLLGSWSNSGSINVNGGTVNLGGAFTLGNLGNFTRTGGMVNVAGTFDNRGQSFVLNDSTGSWQLTTGAILGGSLAATGGAQLLVAESADARLDGVTLDADLLVPQYSTLTVANGVNLSGRHITLGTSSNNLATLKLAGADALVGSGELLLQMGDVDVLPEAGGQSIRIPAGITVRSQATVAVIGQTGSALVNEGEVLATTGLLTLRGDTVANSGTIRVAGGTVQLSGAWENSGKLVLENGTLRLGGTFTTSAVGSLQRTGGTVWVNGTIDNTGQVFELDDSMGPWFLATGGRIIGGTIGTEGAMRLVPTGDGALDGVMLAGSLKVPGFTGLQVFNGLTLSPGGRITLDGTTGGTPAMRFQGGQTVGGAGEIVLDGTSDGEVTVASGTLTIAPGITVRTGQRGGTLGFAGGPLSGTLINRGRISAQTSNRTLSIRTQSFTNEGIVEARDGGTVQLLGAWGNAGTFAVNNGTLDLGGTFTTAGIGTIARTGGTIAFTGTLDNHQATFALNSATGSIELRDRAKIVGGVVVSDGASVLITPYGSSTIEAATVESAVMVRGGTLTLRDGATFRNTRVTFESSPGGQIQYAGSATQADAVEFVFNPTSTMGSSIRSDGTGTLTLGPDVLVRTAGGSGSVGSQDTSWVNQGTIWAATGGQTLALAGNWTNQGILKVTAGALGLGGNFTTQSMGTIQNLGGTLAITGTLNNAGSTLIINQGTGPLTLQSQGKIIGGTVRVEQDGMLFAAGTATLDAVDLQGELRLDNNANLTITQSTTLDDGRIVLAAPSTGNAAVLWLPPDLSSTGGQIIFEGSHPGNTIANASLVVGPTVSIRSLGGGGQLSSGGASLINDGSISAETSGYLLYVNHRMVTNRGTLLASGGGLLVLHAGGATNGVFLNQGELISTGAGKIQVQGNFYPAQTNEGMIHATGGGTIELGAIDNRGTILADTGGSISLGSGWKNSGSITANGASLYLSPPAAGTGFDSVGGTNSSLFFIGGHTTAQVRGAGVQDSVLAVYTGGTLDNTADTITVETGSNRWQLAGGKIVGGTITSTSGTALRAASGDSTLDAVALLADLTVDGGAKVTLANMTQSTGRTFRVNGNGTVTSIRFSSDHTLAGASRVIFDGGGGNLVTANTGRTLTVGADAIVITGTGGGTVGSSGATTISHGLIASEMAGKTLVIQGTFSNLGTVRSANGGTIRVTGGWSSNGAIDTSLLTNDGTFTQSGGDASVGALRGTGNTTVAIGQEMRAASIRQQSLTVRDGATVEIAPDGGDAGFSVLQSLLLEPNAVLDLADNDLAIRGTSPVTSLAAVEKLIASARNDGQWDGPGIRVSSARTDPNHGLGAIRNARSNGSRIYSILHGVSLDANAVLLIYTLNGDSNVNGSIDADDYARIDRAFLNHSGGWAGGDSDYSGLVDLDDYTRIDMAFLAQEEESGVIGLSDLSAEPALAAALHVAARLGDSTFIPNGSSIVPEAQMAWMPLALLVARFGRRRRRTSGR